MLEFITSAVLALSGRAQLYAMIIGLILSIGLIAYLLNGGS